MSVDDYKLSALTTEGFEVVKTSSAGAGKYEDYKTKPLAVLMKESGEEVTTAPEICGIRRNIYSEDYTENFVMNWVDLELRTSEVWDNGWGVEVWGAKHEVLDTDKWGKSGYDRKQELELIAKVSGPEVVRASSRKDLPDTFRTEAERQQVLQAFNRFDLDKSGMIERSELMTVLQQFDPAHWKEALVDELLQEVDVNEDGKIDYDELLHYLFTPSRFRKKLQKIVEDTDALVTSNVTVSVVLMGGETIFGPTELDGRKTAVELKEAAKLRGRLVLASGDVLDSKAPLGSCCPVAAGDARALQLTLLVRFFDQIAEDCLSQLQDLGALQEFDGQPCIRLLNGKSSHCAGGGSGGGEDLQEFMLTSDGCILAKKYHYFGYMESSGEWNSSSKWEIAEGTFSFVDPATCTIDVVWQAHADKTKRDHADDGWDNTGRTTTVKEWEAREVSDLYKPYTIIPNEGSQTKVLEVAQQWMGGTSKLPSYEKQKKGYRGIAMPGIPEELIKSIDMDPAHTAYWTDSAADLPT